MTIAPAVVIRVFIAIRDAIRARRAKRRLTHRDDIEARPLPQTVEKLEPPSLEAPPRRLVIGTHGVTTELPERPTERE